MAKGYAGKILMVDLSNGTIDIEKPGEDIYRKYLGGSALGLYYLLKECPPKADPLGPDNVLVFTSGPTVGAPFPGNSRLNATAKSPLTGMVGDSQIGGYLPAELKFSGFDAIIIKGNSSKPVYLWINNGEAEIQDARHLWGKDSIETENIIKQEIGDPKTRILEIGPAGEKLSRISAIMHLGSRAFGRSGLGAVMGSKKLKAIAIRGTIKPSFADPKVFQSLSKYAAEQVKSNPTMQDLYLNGTNGSFEPMNASGGLPTRNYNEGQFEDADNLNASNITKTILKGRETCFACSVRCKRVVEVLKGPYPVDPRYGGAEYESVAALGSYCGVSNVAAVHLANQYCNSYGLDTISTGATIAFAMECYENGILTNEQTDGIELCFGNADALIAIIQKIGKREGLGDLLAEGSQRAAEAIGPKSFQFLTTAKGQELPAHMPHLKKSLSLIYAVNPFGADHESTEHDPSYEEGAGSPYKERMGQLGLHDAPKFGSFGPEKVRMTVYTQRFMSLLDTIPLCHFCFAIWTMYDPNHVVDVVKAATGWDTNMFELMLIGERRINLLRAFNARDGITRDADTLPEKVFKPLQGQGPLAGTAIDREEWQQALNLYYQMSGWDAITGNPTRSKYEELGLSWIADMVKA